MDRNFARSLKLVLQSEGGWSDDPRDSGGATMHGITLATYRAFIKPGGSKADLRAITDEQVATCYRQQYWAAVGGDDLPDGVDYATFDFCVNSGVSRAARYLQSVVGAPLDGSIGPATLAAVAKVPAGVIIDRLCDARLAFMKSAKDRDGNLLWPTFGKGWAIRVASVRKDALLMTESSIAAPAPTNPAPAPQPASPAPVKPLPAPAAPAPAPTPPVVAREPQPLQPKPPAAKPAAIIGVAGVLVLAVTHWWHELAAWVAIHWPF